MRTWPVLLLLLAGCVSDDPAAIDDPAPELPVVLEASYQNFTGTLTSLLVSPDEATGSLDVPLGTGRITATLLWDDPLAQLSFHLDAQNATGHAGGFYAGSDGRAEADIPEPSSGVWDYRIVGENAVNVDWTLVVYLAPGDDVVNVLRSSEVIAAGQFFEINTEMEQGATMHWDWQTSDGSASAFNVHTHFDDEVQYLVEETVASHAGKVTADRTGGYSLMWENTGTTPQTIEYAVWGDFVVDSYFPPR